MIKNRLTAEEARKLAMGNSSLDDNIQPYLEVIYKEIRRAVSERKRAVIDPFSPYRMLDLGAQELELIECVLRADGYTVFRDGEILPGILIRW